MPPEQIALIQSSWAQVTPIADTADGDDRARRQGSPPWTLEQGLGEAFTPAHAEAWGAAYGILADTMIAAAEEAFAA